MVDTRKARPKDISWWLGRPKHRTTASYCSARGRTRAAVSTRRSTRRLHEKGSGGVIVETDMGVYQQCHGTDEFPKKKAKAEARGTLECCRLLVCIQHPQPPPPPKLKAIRLNVFLHTRRRRIRISTTPKGFLSWWWDVKARHNDGVLPHEEEEEDAAVASPQLDSTPRSSLFSSQGRLVFPLSVSFLFLFNSMAEKQIHAIRTDSSCLSRLRMAIAESACM